MKSVRENLMNLLRVERRKSPLERVATVAGLVVGGALIGAGIAFLVAPKAGVDLRRELSHGALGPLLHPIDTLTHGTGARA